MNNEKKELNIYQRINEVKKCVSRIGKDTDVKAGAGSYKALSHDKVVYVLRVHLVANGIITIIKSIEETNSHSEWEETTKFGNNPLQTKRKFKHFCRVKVCMEYINADNPEDRFEAWSLGAGEDFGDKAPGKAISYATKYNYLKTFDIETGENDEFRLPEQEPTEQVETISDADWNKVCELAKSADFTKENGKWVDMQKALKVPKLRTMTKAQFESVKLYIDNVKAIEEDQPNTEAK